MPNKIYDIRLNEKNISLIPITLGDFLYPDFKDLLKSFLSLSSDNNSVFAYLFNSNNVYLGVCGFTLADINHEGALLNTSTMLWSDVVDGMRNDLKSRSMPYSSSEKFYIHLNSRQDLFK